MEYDPLAPPDHPWAALDALREQCPAHRTPKGIVHTVGYPTVTSVLADHETYSSRSLRPPAEGEVEQLLHLDGAEHVRVRRIANKALPKRFMLHCQPWVEEIARELLTPHLGSGGFDLVPALSQPLPAIVFFRLLGIPEFDRERFISWADDAVEHSHRSEEPPSHPEFVAYARERIEHVRAHPGEDILSSLVHTEVNGQRLTDDELVAMVRILIVAGTETTANAISTLFHQLLSRPELWEKVKADESLRAVAVEEALRIDPPLAWIPRIAAAATEIAGVEIPAGCVVAVNLASANHDPTHYADPHTFRLDRSKDEPTPVTFGFASHFCIGAPLAKVELRGALNTVLDLFPDLHLPADYEWKPRGPVMMRGAKTLPVRFALRS
ncbi:cytochrome P450 [Sporichthya polymorpha]|uniref:cytochrome P450 n=1 Tax=Sporichthya polymorpha TaxID=35751 RepID=UPI00037D15E0|nr:cytochrome P450 [Sporichthya polymorpha]